MVLDSVGLVATNPHGYSGTPLDKKLGIKPGHRVLVSHPPAGFLDQTLGPVPGALITTRAGKTPYDMVIAFHSNQRSYRRDLKRDIGRITRDGSLWIGWPKKSSGIETDINQDIVRELALAARVVDVKVCAIDETWSGVKLVYRLSDR